jgi:fatty-acyl-CoA synthase
VENARTGSEGLAVVAEADGAVPEADLRRAIARAISDIFMVQPSDVRVVAERWLVKSTSGKISRAENRAKYVEHFR